MPFLGATGKVTFLRVGRSLWGPPGDVIDAEVVVKLDTKPDLAFGWQLRAADPQLPSRLAMLAVLRDAYIHNLTIHIAYDIGDGKKNGWVSRIDMHEHGG